MGLKKSISPFIDQEAISSRLNKQSRDTARRAQEAGKITFGRLRDSMDEHLPTAPSKKALPWWSLGVVAIALALSWQLLQIQIVRGEEYQAQAAANRARKAITYAQRGRILDRNGVVLADNTAGFRLTVFPYLVPEDESQRRELLEGIAFMLPESADQLQQALDQNTLSSVEPLIVSEQLSHEQALLLKEQLDPQGAFSVEFVPTRRYVAGDGLAHILGYVGRVNEDELAADDGLFPTDYIGKDGVEAMYDDLLRGVNGVAVTEVDSLGRPLRIANRQQAQSGQDLVLTIDSKLQRAVAQSLAKHMNEAGVNRGAAVAMDPHTGEVLASVSMPDYDNNLFADGIQSEEYQALINNPLEPLHNKVIGGAYPSGSIIKPIHLAAALQEGVVNENTQINDTGKIVVSSVYDPSVQYVFEGWRPEGLGVMNARRAIAMSSNIYFFTTGGGYQGFEGLGIDRLSAWYHKFGLGEYTNVDLPGETKGLVPDPAWKEEVAGEPWFVGDTYNLSIGQGSFKASPLQMVRATSAIVNNGSLLRPRFVRAENSPPEVQAENLADAQNFQIIREGMREVVTSGTTCSCTFAKVPVPVGGKSGTAETDPNADRDPHAWYSAFAPYDNPEVVMTVLLEEGEGGSKYAAPVIADAFEYYFSGR